jgi:hypothetical protein
MAASKVTEICEKFPEIHTHCPQVNRASSWFSYPTAGNVALGRIGILLMHIPKGRPNPKVNRAGRWPPYPPVGCPPDCQLCISVAAGTQLGLDVSEELGSGKLGVAIRISSSISRWRVDLGVTFAEKWTIDWCESGITATDFV